MASENSFGANLGFLCPDCIVRFPSTRRLEEHWFRFHCKEDAIAKRRRRLPSRPSLASENFLLGNQRHRKSAKLRMLHDFKTCTVNQHAPLVCAFCGDIIWNCAKICKDCYYVAHADCQPLVVSSCNNSPHSLNRETKSVGESTSASTVGSPRGPPLVASSIMSHGHQQVRSYDMESSSELDLTYVTERFVSMSFPASGLETAYRDNLLGVSQLLQQKHADKYMIFNVSERRYDIAKLNKKVCDFGWPDHLAPPLDHLIKLIQAIDSWLRADSKNIVVVHCKGGTSRIGVVVAAYVQFSKVSPSPQAALDWFALKRFYDAKLGGVAQPSQNRYVQYFADILEKKFQRRKRSLYFQNIIMHGIPYHGNGAGMRFCVKIYQGYQLKHTTKTFCAPPDTERFCVSIGDGVKVHGDVMVKCCQNESPAQNIIFRVQFHTDALDDCVAVYGKYDLDEACREKRFPDSSYIEFVFAPDSLPKEEVDLERELETLTARKTSCSPELDAIAAGFLVEPSDARFGKSGIFDMERRMAGALETERSGVYYIAGPVNGNPYAQIDHSLKAKLRSKPDQEKPYDLAKGIEDLDSLLGDLGYNSAPSSPGFSQNAHVLISSPDKRELKATVLLNKEINNNQPDLRPRKDSFDVQGGLTSNTPLSSPPALDLRTEVNGSKTVPNIDYSRQLAAVTNQPGAGLRMETKPVVEGHIAVSLDTPMHSAAPLLNRERSSASDDVFDSEAKAPSSPTISDLWFDVSKSSLAKGASKKNMSLTRYDNVSYSDTESRSSQSLSRQDSADGMEIQPGIVASHVKSLNRLLFGDDLGDHESQYKKKYGVPLAGLNSPEIVEKKVTQFNLRSAVPGQLAPQTTQIYTRGAFHAVDYDHHEEPRKSSELESVHLRHVVANGYPPAAEDDDSELPHRADTLIRARQPSLTRHEIHTRSPPVLRLVDGRLDAKPPIVDMNRAMVDMKPTLVAKKSDLVGTTLIMADEGDLPKIDAHHEADSAYGDSMRSSASYPSSATTPNTTPVTSQLPDAALAVSRKFDGMTVSDAKDEPHRRAIAIEASRQSSADRAPFIPPSGIFTGASSTSSWSSIDDEGGGYAKIEDLQLDCATERVLTERVGSPTSAGGSEVPSSRPPASALKVVEEDLQSEVIQKHDEFLNDDVFRYLDLSDVRTEAKHKPTKVPPVSPVSPSSETQGLRANVANGTSGLGLRAGLVYGDLNYAIPPNSASQKKAGSPASLDSTVLGVSTVASRWLDQPLLVSTSTAESTSSCLGESSTGSVSDGSSSPRSPSTVRRTLRRRMRGSNSNSSVSSAELFHEVERYPQIKFDKETIHYWYKPMLTREQATALLRERDCGAFVVRDSQSYEGAFGLAVKVETPPLGVLQQAGGDLTKIDLDNELVRHFLIEPCKKGVRLKGSNNEPPFPSLVALVYQHTLTRMALPVALVIPEEDLEESRNGLKSTLTESQLLHKGAACNLVYLGGMDVESLTGDGAVQYAMNKLVSGNHPQKWTLVSIKVNQEGITLTDNQRRLFFRRHYMMKLVLHCGVDPKGRTFNLKVVVKGSDREASCFGFVVAKHALSLDNECHLFAELDVDQPSSAVINFIHKAMRYAKV